MKISGPYEATISGAVYYNSAIEPGNSTKKFFAQKGS